MFTKKHKGSLYLVKENVYVCPVCNKRYEISGEETSPVERRTCSCVTTSPKSDSPNNRKISLLVPNSTKELYVELDAFDKAKIRYFLIGPENGDLVVLLHGIVFYSFVFDILANFLAKTLNKRVLFFDFLGHGLSDPAPPKSTFNLDFYCSQVISLLSALKLFDQSITIIGHGVGGGTGAALASTFPDQIKKLILIAPVGFPLTIPLQAKMARMPLLGDLASWLFLETTAMSFVEGCFHNSKKCADTVKECKQRILECMKVNTGFSTAIISTLRHFPLEKLEEIYASIDSTKVYLIWGADDLVVPYNSCILRVQKLLPNAKFVPFQDTGHACFVESPSDSNLMIKHILENNSNENCTL